MIQVFRITLEKIFILMLPCQQRQYIEQQYQYEGLQNLIKYGPYSRIKLVLRDQLRKIYYEVITALRQVCYSRS